MQIFNLSVTSKSSTVTTAAVTTYKQQKQQQQKQKQQHLINTYTTNASRSSYPAAGYLILFQMLLLLSQVELSHSDWLMDCGDCHCKWNSGKKTADCRNLSLASVPENLSSEIQVLDLSHNRIQYLEQNAFFTAQLQNLHKLYIRNSTLQNIDPRSFTSLEILIELDLSNNLLRSLKPNLFARLVKVRALVLNGNLLESLGEGIFQNLKYLHKIELKNNRLMRVGTQVFVNVPLLSQIYMDGNRLSFLRKESFETLKRLTALSLDQNPWNCTCELQIFRDFVLKRNLYTPPTSCYYPAHLRGMLWVEDQPEAFACKPRIIYPTRGASINTSKENVTLICRVHASPNTLIAWDYNKQMYRANVASGGQQQRVHIQLLRDEQSKEKEFGRDVFISRLTILGAEKSDEGIYTCLAENAGGKDAVQMSLLVQKPGPKDLLLQGNLIIVIGLMALGLLSASVFLAMVTCCIYKRFKAISPGHLRHLRHHHMEVGADAMTTAVDSATTPVVGGTDVVLGVTADNANHHQHHYNNFHHHSMHQKTNLNGGSGIGGQHDKYDGYAAETIKHGVSIMDNGTIGRGGGGNGGGGSSVAGSNNTGTVGHQLLLTDSKLLHAEKAYLEKKHEDTLHIKYPHGKAPVETCRLIANSSGGEYQPDLLPAYNKGNNNNSGSSSSIPKGHLHSPTITNATARAINQQQQQQQQQQEIQLQQDQQASKHFPTSSYFQTTSSSSASASTAAAVLKGNNKYNTNTQEYLTSRATLSQSNKAALGSAVMTTIKQKSSKREMPSIPLTTSASLLMSTSASAAAAAAAAAAASSSSLLSNESQFVATTTLQRHSKSLVLTSTHQRNTTPPTDSTYEYRQPPPPPYYSTHNTTNAVSLSSGSAVGSSSSLLARHRTNSNKAVDDDEVEQQQQQQQQQQQCKDLGYRDENIKKNDCSSSAYETSPHTSTTLTRQTIVTASPSLNFLTTTGYTPRRQLL